LQIGQRGDVTGSQYLSPRERFHKALLVNLNLKLPQQAAGV